MNIPILLFGIVVLIIAPIAGPMLPFISITSTNITNLAVNCPTSSSCVASATITNNDQTVTGAITILTNIMNTKNQFVDLESQTVTIPYGTSQAVRQPLAPLGAGSYTITMFVVVQNTPASNSATAQFNTGSYILIMDACGTNCDQFLTPAPKTSGYAEPVGTVVPISFSGGSQWTIGCWIVLSSGPKGGAINICDASGVGPSSWSLTMDSNKEIIPQIWPISQSNFINITPDLSTEANGVGVFNPNTAQTVWPSGVTCPNGNPCPTSVTFQVVDGSGVFQSWSVQGTTLKGTTFPITLTYDQLVAAGVKPNSSVLLTGIWVDAKLTLTIVGQPNVTLSPAAGSYQETVNSQIIIHATPTQGYCIANWIVNNNKLAGGNSVTVIMSDNTQVSPVVAQCGSQSTGQKYATYTLAGVGILLILIGIALPSRKVASRV